jgi:hypothetical protein
MKVEIVYRNGYYDWDFWDGPECGDHFRGTSNSLGQAMEHIIEKKIENDKYYKDTF